MTRFHRLSVEALEDRDLLAAGLTTYLALDDPRGALAHTTAKFNEFVAALRSYGVDTIEGFAGFSPDPTLTFGSTGITAATDVNFVAPFAALAVSGNNSLYDQGPGSPGGPDIPDVFTFNTPITAFALFLSNTGDGPANTLTFLLENTITGTSKAVVAGTFGPNATNENVIFWGVTDTDPFNRVTMRQSYDYDGTLLDNITAGQVAVTASAGGPYFVSEGNALNLNANPAGETVPDGYTYSWDINGDGVFGDAAGVTPTLTWAQLTAVGINDGAAAWNVRVRVTDNLGTVHESSPATLTVNNVAPTASLSIPVLGLRAGGQAGNAVRGQSAGYVLSAVDPSTVDQVAGFTFLIDWDGNGNTDQTVVGSSGVAVQHVFANSGVYNVRVTAVDKDGGVSSVAQQSVRVVDWDLRSNAGNPALTDLIWGGTNGFDAYFFIFPGLVLIQAQNNALFPTPQSVFTGAFNGKAYVYAQGSGDLVFADVMSASMVIDGGDGDDVLIGGRGADAISGGNGNDIIFGGTVESDASDTLEGGAGNDLLVGHFGADILRGGSGQDLLVAARIVFNDLPGAVFNIQAEWASGRPLAQKVANLSGTGTGPRNNGSTFLVPGVNVLDDSPTAPAVIDQVFGEGDDDWMLFDFSDDIAPDASDGDVLTNLA